MNHSFYFYFNNRKEFFNRILDIVSKDTVMYDYYKMKNKKRHSFLGACICVLANDIIYSGQCYENTYYYYI